MAYQVSHHRQVINTFVDRLRVLISLSQIRTFGLHRILLERVSFDNSILYCARCLKPGAFTRNLDRFSPGKGGYEGCTEGKKASII